MLHKITKMLSAYIASVHDRKNFDLDHQNFTAVITVTSSQRDGSSFTVTNTIKVVDCRPAVYSETVNNASGQLVDFISGKAKAQKEIEKDNLVKLWRGTKQVEDSLIPIITGQFTSLDPQEEGVLSVQGSAARDEPMTPTFPSITMSESDEVKQGFLNAVDVSRLGTASSEQELTFDSTTAQTTAPLVTTPVTKKIRAKKAAKEVKSE